MIDIWDISSLLAVVVLVAAWFVRRYHIGWKCGGCRTKPAATCKESGACSKVVGRGESNL
jgi:hypothetical protein